METRDEKKTRGTVLVVSAPSGAGKSTLCTMMLNRFPGLSYSISHTTRPPRGNEKSGIDYHFISEEEFKRRIDRNLWAEWAMVHGNFYGTSREMLERSLSRGDNVLLDIDVQGAGQIVKAFPEAVTIFIMPPSLEVLEERLRKRGTDSEDTIQKRLLNAEAEMAGRDFYKYVVVNDDLADAEKDMIRILSDYNGFGGRQRKPFSEA
ncbi:MAG: guanylate kinase [Desulfamplus sp.]|nr:guanylate kinase [Desulfamplus sp.]